MLNKAQVYYRMLISAYSECTADAYINEIVDEWRLKEPVQFKCFFLDDILQHDTRLKWTI